MDCILLTGGAGYIGSHTAIELLESGYKVILVDNFYNSDPGVIRKITNISGKSFSFYKGDVKNRSFLESIFMENSVDSVMHFAGLKSVSESCNDPLKYYNENMMSALALCSVMAKYNVLNLVFSSSATVYGSQKIMPIEESFELGKPSNPYGKTKLYVESLLNDLYLSNPSWSIAILRYFNPVGCHPSGLLGESPKGVPNNLFPYIGDVVAGKREMLNVYGDDYDTPDGTGVRDYIHVIDLAKGHLAALQAIRQSKRYDLWNLGTGTGHSVLEVLKVFSQQIGYEIPYRIVGRRSGDVGRCYASVVKASNELGWRAKLSLDEMVSSHIKYVRTGAEI